mmetsp:Transcript_5512/g.11685  ORF Transcript_5512/g.11685 Transcript_5512/m.11685 type:complete len:305 (+) Transcript_5512:273-1187(+)
MDLYHPCRVPGGKQQPAQPQGGQLRLRNLQGPGHDPRQHLSKGQGGPAGGRVPRAGPGGIGGRARRYVCCVVLCCVVSCRALFCCVEFFCAVLRSCCAGIVESESARARVCRSNDWCRRCVSPIPRRRQAQPGHPPTNPGLGDPGQRRPEPEFCRLRCRHWCHQRRPEVGTGPGYRPLAGKTRRAALRRGRGSGLGVSAVWLVDVCFVLFCFVSCFGTKYHGAGPRNDATPSLSHTVGFAFAFLVGWFAFVGFSPPAPPLATPPTTTQKVFPSTAPTCTRNTEKRPPSKNSRNSGPRTRRARST